LFVWRRACSGVRVHEAVAAAMATRTTTGAAATPAMASQV
jgi:hypothetical protein